MRWTIPMAIAAIAALTGCASAGGPAGTSAPAAPPSASADESPAPATSHDHDDSPSPSPAPEAPHRITDDAVLGSYDALEIPGDEPIVAWADGGSAVHVIGTGSGSESCQPSGESIELDDGVLEIEFEPADPAQACTADLRVFGWSFPAPQGSDASITTARIDGWAEGAGELTVEIRAEAG